VAFGSVPYIHIMAMHTYTSRLSPALRANAAHAHRPPAHPCVCQSPHILSLLLGAALMILSTLNSSSAASLALLTTALFNL